MPARKIKVETLKDLDCFDDECLRKRCGLKNKLGCPNWCVCCTDLRSAGIKLINVLLDRPKKDSWYFCWQCMKWVTDWNDKTDKPTIHFSHKKLTHELRENFINGLMAFLNITNEDLREPPGVTLWREHEASLRKRGLIK